MKNRANVTDQQINPRNPSQKDISKRETKIIEQTKQKNNNCQNS